MHSLSSSGIVKMQKSTFHIYTSAHLWCIYISFRMKLNTENVFPCTILFELFFCFCRSFVPMYLAQWIKSYMLHTRSSSGSSHTHHTLNTSWRNSRICRALVSICVDVCQRCRRSLASPLSIDDAFGLMAAVVIAAFAVAVTAVCAYKWLRHRSTLVRPSFVQFLVLFSHRADWIAD